MRGNLYGPMGEGGKTQQNEKTRIGRARGSGREKAEGGREEEARMEGRTQ